MNRFADRLSKRMRELNLNQVAVYKRIGVSRGTVSGWVNGTMDQPRGTNLEKLAGVLRCTPKWLAFGDDDDTPAQNNLGFGLPGDTENYAFVSILDSDEQYPIHHAIIDRTGIPAKRLAVMEVLGDAMAETLQDGDTILIHTDEKAPVSGNLYTLKLGDEVIIRRFIRRLSGAWQVVSDNPDKNLYPDEQASEQDINELEILGRVIRIIDRAI